MRPETRRQVGGIMLTPDWIDNPKLALPDLKKMVEHGYFIFDILMRHQVKNLLDPRVHDAVKTIVEMGHTLGLKAMLDTDHFWWGGEFAELNPDAAVWVFCPATAVAVDGHFDVELSFPKLPTHHIFFQELSAAYRTDGATPRAIPVSKVDYDWQSFRRIRKKSQGLVLRGTVPGKYSGSVVFYVAVKSLALADVAHPKYLKAQEHLLDMYADIPLDGFGWDEPGKGMGQPDYFKAGAGFLKFFKKRTGYDLRSKLIYLDYYDDSPRAIRTRNDYYTALNDMNTLAQKRHNDHAQKLFGCDLVFGSHHTWSGFSMDMAAGVIDYFGLGRSLTAAWTDGGTTCELKFALFNYLLADGIRKELGLRDAYFNDWTPFMPSIEELRMTNRVKKLFHVNWFNHCVSDFSECLVNYKFANYSQAVKREIEEFDRFDELLGDGMVADTDVAMLYNWKSMAGSPKWMIRMLYTGLLNTVYQLVDSGLCCDLMSEASIRKARIGKGSFTIGGRRYRVMVVPYGNIIDAAAYKKIMKMSDAGIPVVFFGPAPEFTAEKGNPIGEDFARRAGMKPVSFQEFMAVYKTNRSVPGPNDIEPLFDDFIFPVVATDGQIVRDVENEVVSVQSSKAPVYYLPSFDPRENLVNVIKPLVESTVDTIAQGAFTRVFVDPKKKNSRVLVAVAHLYSPGLGILPERFGMHERPTVRPRDIRVRFQFSGDVVEMIGGSWCAVRIDGEQVTQVIGDCPDVRMNGTTV